MDANYRKVHFHLYSMKAFFMLEDALELRKLNVSKNHNYLSLFRESTKFIIEPDNEVVLRIDSKSDVALDEDFKVDHVLSDGEIIKLIAEFVNFIEAPHTKQQIKFLVDFLNGDDVSKSRLKKKIVGEKASQEDMELNKRFMDGVDEINRKYIEKCKAFKDACDYEQANNPAAKYPSNLYWKLGEDCSEKIRKANDDAYLEKVALNEKLGIDHYIPTVRINNDLFRGIELVEY